MKSCIFFLLLVSTTTCILAQGEPDVVTEEPSSDGFEDDQLQEFVTAYGEGNKEKMAKLTIEVVKYSKGFQRRSKLMVAVKSQVLKMLKRFTDLERFASLRGTILNLLTKLVSRDNKTPAQLQSMIKWVEKRKIDGNSVNGNLDDAARDLGEALKAFKATQEPVIVAVNGIREATALGQPFDQEKVRGLIQAVVDAAEDNRDKFLPNIETAVKAFDLTVSQLRRRDE